MTRGRKSTLGEGFGTANGIGIVGVSLGQSKGSIMGTGKGLCTARTAKPSYADAAELENDATLSAAPIDLPNLGVPVPPNLYRA